MFDSIIETLVFGVCLMVATIVFISFTCEIIDETNIGKVGHSFEFKERIYKIVVDSAATDSLHNWRAK